MPPQVQDARGELSHSELRTREVLENGYWTSQLAADLSDRLDVSRVLVLSSMCEVQPEDICPRADQLAQHHAGTRSRPDGADYLGRYPTSLCGPQVPLPPNV